MSNTKNLVLSNGTTFIGLDSNSGYPYTTDSVRNAKMFDNMKSATEFKVMICKGSTPPKFNNFTVRELLIGDTIESRDAAEYEDILSDIKNLIKRKEELEKNLKN